MANWRREMAQPGNWRANVAWIDRFDRGRFADDGERAVGSNGEAVSAEARRPDLSRLSEGALAELEALGTEEPEEEQ